MKQGIKIVHYRNEEIMKNIEGVLEDIKNNCLKIENN
jgi:very-short-patch-repair endonuclease